MSMKKQYKLHYLWFIFLCIVVFSCKKKDEEEPSLSIITPFTGQKFSYTPTIDVSGSVNDNKELQAIEVSVLDNQFKLASGVVRYPISKNAKSFSVSYEVTDVYLPQGKYHIKVQAIDMANNRKSAFVEIYLDELPLSLRKIYYVGTNEQIISIPTYTNLGAIHLNLTLTEKPLIFVFILNIIICTLVLR